MRKFNMVVFLIAVAAIAFAGVAAADCGAGGAAAGAGANGVSGCRTIGFRHGRDEGRESQRSSRPGLVHREAG